MSEFGANFKNFRSASESYQQVKVENIFKNLNWNIFLN